MRNWEYYLVVVAAGPRPIDRRRIRLLTTPTSTPSNTHARGLAKLKDLGTSPRPGAVCGTGILFDRGTGIPTLFRSRVDLNAPPPRLTRTLARNHKRLARKSIANWRSGWAEIYGDA